MPIAVTISGALKDALEDAGFPPEDVESAWLEGRYGHWRIYDKCSGEHLRSEPITAEDALRMAMHVENSGTFFSPDFGGVDDDEDAQWEWRPELSYAPRGVRRRLGEDDETFRSRIKAAIKESKKEV